MTWLHRFNDPFWWSMGSLFVGARLRDFVVWMGWE